MNIHIPVAHNVETIIAKMYIDVNVALHPKMPPRTTEGKLAVEQIQQVLQQEVYVAVKNALDQIEKKEVK